MGEKSAPLIPHALVPERRIIVDPVSDVPQWKVLWDNARDFATSGMIEEAIQQYQALLAVKPALEEGQWELARLWMHTKKWPEAASQLEVLVERSSQKSDYLKALGKVVWEMKQYDRAVDLFGRVFEKNPSDQDALAGLVEGLIKLNRKKEALPLLERLYQLQPDNLGVQRYLALLGYELREYEKARVYLNGLTSQKNADMKILELAATVHERLGRPHEAVEYWERILKRKPGHEAALASLGRYYQKKGKTRQALPHLLAMLKKDPDDSSLLLKIGHIYRKKGQHSKAISYYQHYLAQNPDDKKIHQLVIESHRALGAKDEALAALERYFSESPDPADPAHLQMAATLYDTAGRYQEAISLYLQMVENNPRDQKILAALVNDQLMVGDDEGALQSWKQMVAITEKPLPIYRKMAGLMEQLGKKREYVEILKKINELDPVDQDVLLELATGALKEKRYEDAQIYFAQLTRTGHRSLTLFEGQGGLFARNGEILKAVTSYEEALKLAPERHDLRLDVIGMAGHLGLVSVFKEHISFLEQQVIEGVQTPDSYTLDMAKAEALLGAGYFAQALEIYNRLERDVISPVFRQELGLAIAGLYAKADLPYEAEQKLRQILIFSIDREPVINALFELTLANRRTADAEVWLAASAGLSEAKRNSTLARDPHLQLKQARLAGAKKEWRRAIRLCRQLFTELSSSELDALKLETGLVLGQFLLQANKVDDGAEVARSLSTGDVEPLAVSVLREQLLKQANKPEIARELARHTLVRARNDGPNALIRLAEDYKNYKDAEGLAAVAESLAKQLPQSIKSVFFLAEAMEQQGRQTEALQELRKLAAPYPGNTHILVNTARLTFMTGAYAESLKLCEKLIATGPLRPDILLLKARTLWAQDNKSDAVAVYRDFIEPDVDSILTDQMREAGITVNLPPRRTFWNKLSFTSGAPLRITEVVMHPEHALAIEETQAGINRLASPLYALFKWQERFSRELEIRNAVQGHEYNRAVTGYEDLVDEYGKEESLYFDLAGIYNRAGNLTKEGFVYEKMLQNSPRYLGLGSVRSRKFLKKRPLVSLGGGYSEEEGWNSHLAIRKTWQEAEILVTPRIQDEMTLSLSRTNYQSPDHDLRTRSKGALLSYRAGLLQGLTLQLGGGVKDVSDDGHGVVGLFSGRLYGEAGKKIHGQLAFRRDIIDDTVASLTRNIIFKEASVGVSMDVLPNFMVGGKYGVRDYSDGNQKNWYELWSSYILSQEPRKLVITYGFDFQDAKEETTPVISGFDGFAPGDHPYWSPKNYWRNRIGLNFTHQLGIDSLERDFPAYYTLHYTVGHDSRGYDLQEFAGSLFVEWTSSFLVKASADLFHTEGARSKGLALSAIYRW